jgi:hypothetical protein
MDTTRYNDTKNRRQGTCSTFHCLFLKCVLDLLCLVSDPIRYMPNIRKRADTKCLGRALIILPGPIAWVKSTKDLLLIVLIGVNHVRMAMMKRC